MKRARIQVDADACGREGCDGRLDFMFGEDKYVPFTDDKGVTTYVAWCRKCRSALAAGKWTPTRQEERVAWKPTEKQLHPLVMGALNRGIFQVPMSQWVKEVDVDRAYMDVVNTGAVKGAKLDLVVYVHSTPRTGAGTGFHAIEVKRAEDKDARRLDRQVLAMKQTANYAWLVVVDGVPDHEDDEVGLIQYDLMRDAFTVVRRPTHIPKPPWQSPLARHYAQQLRWAWERVPEVQEYGMPKARVKKRRKNTQ